MLLPSMRKGSELVNAEEGIKHGLTVWGALEVGAGDKENDTVDFRKVVTPQPTS